MTAERIEGGYILYARAVLESRLWMCGPDVLRVATWLLLDARSNRKSKKFPGFEQKRGEVVTSLADIAKGCEWFENRKVRRYSRSKVSRILAQLEEIEFLKPISDTFGTHVKICKYDTYQSPSNYKSDNRGTTVKQQRDNSETTMNINNNDNNDNNVKNDIGAEKSALPKSFKKWTLEEFRESIAKACESRQDLLSVSKEFEDYWTEPGAKMMKFQYQKTWETKRRIEKWLKNHQEWALEKMSKPSCNGHGEVLANF